MSEDEGSAASKEEAKQQWLEELFDRLGRQPHESREDVIARYARYGLWIAKHFGDRKDPDHRGVEYIESGPGRMLTVTYLAGWRSLTVSLFTAGEGATFVEMWDLQDKPRAADFRDTRYAIQEVKGNGKRDIAGTLIAMREAYERLKACGPGGAIDPVSGSI